MGIGMWYEMYISDPVAYLFKNIDPRGSLAANVSNSTVRCLSNMPLDQMLANRHTMSQTVRAEVSPKSHVASDKSSTAFDHRTSDHKSPRRNTAPSHKRPNTPFPNPNTRNEVFIDDMEGVRDAVSLSMGAERWRWSSVPSRKDWLTGIDTPLNKLPRVHNAEVHWYSPFAVVKERDLKPSLKDAEGAQNNRQVLAISVPRVPRSEDASPVPNDPIPGDSLWVGLTYPLDQSGIDLSKSQFIELWVDDFHDRHTGLEVPLHAAEMRVQIRRRQVEERIDR